jgi:hypothetical protein
MATTGNINTFRVEFDISFSVFGLIVFTATKGNDDDGAVYSGTSGWSVTGPDYRVKTDLRSPLFPQTKKHNQIQSYLYLQYVDPLKPTDP